MIPQAQAVSEGFENVSFLINWIDLDWKTPRQKEVELSSRSLTFLVQTRETKPPSARRMMMWYSSIIFFKVLKATKVINHQESFL